MENVVLVHGLWMNGTEFKWMDHRLCHWGYRTWMFQYPTVRRGLEENAAALWAFLQGQFGPGLNGIPPGTLHLVCHSLGGLVALRMLETHPEAPFGRMVALGCPFQGSISAQRLARWPLGARLLGGSMARALDGTRPARLPEGRQAGVIAGTLPVGWSHMLWNLEKPNDGVVTVAESHLPGAAHATLPVMHVGLVFSRRAALMARRFLLLGELT
ncbi:MAG: alpha/beta fold hydrolase [Magnetococcales bacterium]|nr:alpha/beta fold hydrolase [Magnetococcales bacterium]